MTGGKGKQQSQRKSPGYMRLADLAQLLDITHAHLANLVRRGTLPTIRIGTAVRVPIAVAKKLMEEGAPSGQRGRRKKVQQ